MEKIICRKCGNVFNYNINDFIGNKECESCKTELTWDNIFPNSNAREFIKLSRMMLDEIKERDKERRNIEYNFLKKQGYEIDFTKIDYYNNLYDSIIKKYPDNTPENWSNFYDEFEDAVCKELKDVDKAISISNAVDISYHSHKNSLRKTYVIIVASTIELIFNEYLNLLIKFSLSEYGQKEFLQKHKRAGVQSLLDEMNYFLEKPFSEIIDDYSKGFYDRWNTCRNKRNDIIHSNDRYITNIELSDFKNLLSEATGVFSNLVGDLYKNNQA